MSAPIEFRRVAIGDPWAPGLWYKIDQPNPTKAVICCPGCGGRVAIVSHEIGADGVVTPELGCPLPSCDFVQRIRLVNWRCH